MATSLFLVISVLAGFREIGDNLGSIIKSKGRKVLACASRREDIRL